MSFPLWEKKCGGCNHELKKGDEEPHYRFICPECNYEGCHECMPMGRGSRCKDCVDPETGE